MATVAAYFVKGLCGFANTLVFTSVLGFGVANVNISPVELVLGYPSNLIMTWRNRKKLKAAIVVPLAVLVVAGIIPGAFLLKNANIQYLKIAFGVVIILIGIEMLLRDKSAKKAKESRLVRAIIGILSGVLCGLFGVGALLAAYINRVADSTDEFKANISAVFVVENTVRLFLYSAMEIITLSTLKQSVMLMPLMLLGLFAGIKSAQILNEKIESGEF